MEASTSEKYVINYADSKVISKTGALTIQNRNDFDIVVHLLCEGEPEIVSDKISSGGCYSFLQVAADKEYTVGIHAAVDSTFSMLDLSAKVDVLSDLTAEMLPTLLKVMDIKVVLNDGTLVGKLAPEIDKRLATLNRRRVAY